MMKILIAAALCVAWVQPSSAKNPPGVEAVEFKLRLAPEMATAANRDRLWSVIVGGSAAASQKKCRLVQFLDVPGEYIRGAGFLLRHRTKLATTDCSGPIPDQPNGDLTLKFRATDIARATDEIDAPWAKTGEHKFEQDVTCSASLEGGIGVDRAYSVSSKAEDVRVPQTIGGLRDVYPAALGPLQADTRLDPGCRRVFEERWALEPAASTNLPDEIELAIWYRVSKSGGKTAAPLLAELSFKANLGKPDSQRRADELLSRLIRSLDPSSFAAGGSKTAEAYQCDGP